MQAFRTVGTAEAVLQLLTAFQLTNEEEPDPYQLWVRIKSFMDSNSDYRFSSYAVSNHNRSRPAGQYLADLAELVQAGYVVPLENGKVKVTESGRALAYTRIIPSSLEGLKEKYLGLTTQRSAR